MVPANPDPVTSGSDARWGDPFGAPSFVEPDEEAMLHALDHPLRLRVLGLITAGPMTPRAVARETGRTWQEAEYHLRMLTASGYAEAVTDADGVECYQANPHWNCARALRREAAGLPPELSRDEKVALNRVLWHTSAAAADARLDTLPESADVWLADAEIAVPRKTWEEALALVKQATRLVHEAAVPPGTPGAVAASFTVCVQPWWHTPEEEAVIAEERERYRQRVAAVDGTPSEP